MGNEPSLALAATLGLGCRDRDSPALAAGHHHHPGRGVMQRIEPVPDVGWTPVALWSAVRIPGPLEGEEESARRFDRC